jgi:hypothetical protein
VRDEQTARSVCDELAEGFIGIALPKVEAMAFSEVLIDAWQEGHGQGLTEYERRANLAGCSLQRGAMKKVKQRCRLCRKRRSASHGGRRLSTMRKNCGSS